MTVEWFTVDEVPRRIGPGSRRSPGWRSS